MNTKKSTVFLSTDLYNSYYLCAHVILKLVSWIVESFNQNFMKANQTTYWSGSDCDKFVHVFINFHFGIWILFSRPILNSQRGLNNFKTYFFVLCFRTLILCYINKTIYFSSLTAVCRAFCWPLVNFVPCTISSISIVINGYPLIFFLMYMYCQLIFIGFMSHKFDTNPLFFLPLFKSVCCLLKRFVVIERVKLQCRQPKY